MAAWLLLVAAVAYLAPAALAAAFGGTMAAWEYCCYGLEAACLWAFVFVGASGLVRIVVLWPLLEAAERPACRLAFPMGHPVPLAPGQSLCDAATGLPMTIINAGLVLLLAALLQETARADPTR